MNDQIDNRPMTFKVAMWYGFTLAIIFLVYGGVKIVLSFLDKNYSEMTQLVAFTIYGLIIVSFAIAFSQGKYQKTGWYGLIIVNIIFLINAFVGFMGLESLQMAINIFLGLVSGGMLYCLYAPATKKYLSMQG